FQLLHRTTHFNLNLNTPYPLIIPSYIFPFQRSFINSLTITYIYTRLEESHMEERFIVSFIQCYFIAFGVIIGGSLIGSIGPFLTGEAPLSSMGRIAQSLKIWAIIAAIGGTFDAIENFQKG